MPPELSLNFSSELSPSINNSPPEYLSFSLRKIVKDKSALPLDINWRLEIIPTDNYRAKNLQSFPILPGDSLQVAQDHLTNNVVGYAERGFDAVKDYIQENQDASQWMRPDVALLIVFVQIVGLSVPQNLHCIEILAVPLNNAAGVYTALQCLSIASNLVI